MAEERQGTEENVEVLGPVLPSDEAEQRSTGRHDERRTDGVGRNCRSRHRGVDRVGRAHDAGAGYAVGGERFRLGPGDCDHGVGAA